MRYVPRLCVMFVLSIGTGTAFGWTLQPTPMPLGPADIAQSITTKDVTQGVRFAQIKRGALSASEYWTVNLGFFHDAEAAKADLAAIAALGFTPRLDPGAGRDAAGRALGVWLSVGRFATQDEANDAAAAITKAGGTKFRPFARNTALAGDPATGPWLINVLAIDPHSFTGHLAVALPGGDDLGDGGETVSEAVARTHALAGVNGSFFTNINPAHARLPPRAPVGATVIDGRLVAAATGGKPGFAIRRDATGRTSAALLPKLSTQITLSDGTGQSIAIRTIDRPLLGTVVNCGTPAEAPTTRPAHDVTCTNHDDLVLYDALYLRGTASNSVVDAGYHGLVVEVLVGADGVVRDRHGGIGQAAPSGGFVLQGLGRSAAWLAAHAAPGAKLSVTRKLFSDGHEIPLEPGLSVLEGGPTLLVAHLLDNAAAEGHGPTVAGADQGEGAAIANDNWYNGWVIGRNGRTDIGVTADGTILLVEIDGRNPAISLGTSIEETDAVMRWLGCTQALNLDGGGSSNMVVGGVSVGHPSDATGERGVGDTILVLP